MNANVRREELQEQILDLTEARDAAKTKAEKAALLEQIEALEKAVRELNLADADALGARIDKILGELKKVRDEKPLDAGSALERAFSRLQNFRQRL